MFSGSKPSDCCQYGAAEYDVVCPSDYMISKMIQNDLLMELNFDHIPNAKNNIGMQYWQQSEGFDPENKYSVPYCWGTVSMRAFLTVSSSCASSVFME